MLVLSSGGAELSAADLNPAWTGDLDGMIERRTIRALVPYSKCNGQQKTDTKLSRV